MSQLQDSGKGLLDGTDAIIDDWLGLTGMALTAEFPAYYSRMAAIGSGTCNDGGSLLQKLRALIHANWQAMGSPAPSPASWQWTQTLHFGPHTSEQKTLEKVIVLLWDDWANGIQTHDFVRGDPVDLCHRVRKGEYELIELRYGTPSQNLGPNHPIQAAMDCVLKGVLYLHARKHNEAAEQRELLQASSIHLRVLAPAGYYVYQTPTGESRRFEFAWLENAINAGLHSLDLTFPMDFQFQQFAAEVFDVYWLPRPIAETIPAFRRVDVVARNPVYAITATAPSPMLVVD